MKIFGQISELTKLIFRVGGKEVKLESAAQSNAGPITVTIPNVGAANDTANLITDKDSGTVTSAMIATETITNDDISPTAAVARSKLGTGTANEVVINAADGSFSSEQYLSPTRGGTGITSTATFPASGDIATTSNKISDFASTTSAELQTKISNGTGTAGSLVFSNGPSLSDASLNTVDYLSYDSTSGSISSNSITSPANAPFFRITGTASTLNTISGQAGGKVIVLTNATSPEADIIIANDSGASATSILTGTGEDFTLKPNAAVSLIYDGTSSRWKLAGGSGAGGGSTTDKISAVGLEAGNVVVLDGGVYSKGLANASSTSEVVGIVTKVITVDDEYEITLLGEVSVIPTDFVDADGDPLAVTPNAGTVIFLSDQTAGKLTAVEPATIGHVSVPVGIITSDTSKMYFFPKRGAVVGGTNARTELNLTSSATTDIFNAAAPTLYQAGELTGWVKLGSSQKFYFRAPFAQNGAETNWNISPSYVGDTPPAGFSLQMNSSGVISVTCPSFSGTGLINYALNAPAVGATFPLAVDASSLTTGTVAEARLPSTYSGLLTLNGGVLAAGLTGTSATTAFTTSSGKVGEVVTAATNAVTSTATSGTTAWINATASLSLQAGIWQVCYHESTYRNALIGTSPSGFANIRIFNSTDSTTVAELVFYQYSMAADAEASYAGSGSVSFVINIATTKVLYGQMGAVLNSGTSAAFTTRGTGKFYAVRIA